MKIFFIGVGSILVGLAILGYVSIDRGPNSVGGLIGVAGLSIGGGLCFIAAALSEVGEILGRR
jgi:hypothetical protein